MTRKQKGTTDKSDCKSSPTDVTTLASGNSDCGRSNCGSSDRCGSDASSKRLRSNSEREPKTREINKLPVSRGSVHTLRGRWAPTPTAETRPAACGRSQKKRAGRQKKFNSSTFLLNRPLRGCD